MNMHAKALRPKRVIAFEMFHRGCTYAEIGEAIGTSRQRAQQILRPPIQVLDALRRRACDRCESCGTPLNGGGHTHHTANDATGTFADLKLVRLLCIPCHKKADHEKQPVQYKCMPSAEATALGVRLKDVRLDMQLTQDAMAILLGISRAGYWRVEHGGGCGKRTKKKIDAYLAAAKEPAWKFSEHVQNEQVSA